MNKLHGNHQEEGLVSIVIVTIIIVILALITTGFTKIMDKGLRASLDRELATQANYAAESGLNDAKQYLADAVKKGTVDSIDTNGQCLNSANLPANSPFFVTNGSISGHYSGSGSDNLVKYTCIIIDTKLKQLDVHIPAGHSKIFKIVSTPLAGSMFFGWENSTGGFQPLGPVATHPLPRESVITADETGVLRTTIYGIPQSLGALTLSDFANAVLASASRTYFLYPNGTTPGQIGQKANPFGNSEGTFLSGQCNINNRTTPVPLPYQQGRHYYCNSEVTQVDGLAAPSTVSFYYVRLTALYHDLDVSFQAGDSSSGGNAVPIKSAQASIDVTAEGNDVLKRLQANVSYNSNYDYPNYALQSMDTICKRLRLPKIPAGYGDAIYDDIGATQPYSASDIAQACSGGGNLGANIPYGN
jgi:type II secretory pathway pseudopilin PulG